MEAGSGHHPAETSARHRRAAETADDPAVEARELMLVIEHFVERADTKASILLAAVAAGFLAIVNAMVQTIVWASQGGLARATVEVLFGLALLSLLLSGYEAGRVVLPRLGTASQPNQEVSAPGDLVYFGRLRAIPPKTIASGIRDAVGHDTLIDHYSQQIHVNAAVAWGKYRQLTWAIHLLVPAALFGAAGVLSWMAMRLIG